MRDKSPTRIDSLPLPQDDFKRGYKRWEEMHSRIMQEPPREGRDYISHALKILPFIEAISEVHPIAKGVVSGFKAVLLLEQIREENEMRVAAVFLAGTDTMRVFLDISEVATSDGYRSALHPLNYDYGFEIVLRRIQATIKDCGNSIDTYYKQSRMAKFYKAQDWKSRMAGYIDDFKNHRVQLQEALSLYTASNVTALVTKMSDLVSRLFATKPEWEKALVAKTQSLGDRNEWVKSDAALKDVVLAAEDPVYGGILTNKIESKSDEMRDVQATKLSELRDKLEVPLDELCIRNMDIFESKLAFHTQQLQEAIASSARFVVRTLSGPHDRLLHEDLRELWKEMSWIFCVDNKLFTSALFEYYLDRFSASRIITLESSSQPNNDQQRGPSKADAWTLEYIATHGQQIAIAIDRDNSGFIRISEANAFTSKIPDGWSLSQWCAYTVSGWSYECRIYRKRMHQLMFKLMEMQAKVLRNNRAYLLSVIEQCHPIFAPLAWEPRRQQQQRLPPTTIELRSLVKDKVHSQDAALRAQLEKLQWNMEDESVLRLVFGEVDLEKYVLQLCTLVLEQALILAEISCKLTLEAKEWDRLLYSQLTIRRVVLARVTALSDNFTKNKDASEDPRTHFGGIWSSIDLQKYRADRQDWPIEYTSSDVVDYLHDISLLDEFPLPSVSEDGDGGEEEGQGEGKSEGEVEPKSNGKSECPLRKRLKYIPWEDHIKSMNEDEVPLAIPDEWDPAIVEEGGSAYRTYWGRFPFAERMCDVCHGFPIVERYYGCLTCETRFDICASCYAHEPPSSIEIKLHKIHHPVIKWTLNPRIGQRQWMDFVANGVLEELRAGVRAGVGGVSSDAGDDSEEDDDDDDDEEDDVEVDMDDETEGDIAAGATFAAELGLDSDGDEADDKVSSAGDAPPFSDDEDAGVEPNGVKNPDETAENPNQEAEEMEISNQPKPKDEHDPIEDSLPGEEVVEVQAPIATPSPYMCGRCSESIDWDSTFYRCVGHACRDFFICELCESTSIDSESEVNAKTDDHKWWHSLLVLRKSLIEPVLEAPSSEKDTESTDKDTQTAPLGADTMNLLTGSTDDTPITHSALVSAVVTRLSSVEDNFQVALTAMEEKVDSTRVALEAQINDTRVGLEERVGRLDERIGELMKMVEVLIGRSDG